MKTDPPRCEATPQIVTNKISREIHRLDRILFEGDAKVKAEGAWWWIIRNRRGTAIAFAGMRACLMPENKGFAILTRAGVRRKYRGNGLQKQLIRARIRMARRQGFRELLAYVLGNNLASANSLIACGFRLYAPAEFWAGKKALYFRLVL